MLKQIIALAIALFTLNSTFACDACSCTSMNSLDGQLLPSNRTFLGLSSSYVHQLNGLDQRVNNASYSLYAAYSFAKRWQILGNMPLQHNVIVSPSITKSKQIGLGDASIILSYMPYSTPEDKKSLAKHTLILRAGIKLPTGYYDEDNLQTSNLGTKSVDFLAAGQYIFERNKQGLNLAANVRLNTQNKFAYQYGNKYDVSAFYFVNRETKKTSYMPFIGLAGEYIEKDISKNFVRTLSGGSGFYGLGGFLMRFDDKVSLFVKGELPILQDYKSPDGQVYTNIRAQVQVSYFFKAKTKVSKTAKL